MCEISYCVVVVATSENSSLHHLYFSQTSFMTKVLFFVFVGKGLLEQSCWADIMLLHYRRQMHLSYTVMSLIFSPKTAVSSHHILQLETTLFVSKILSSIVTKRSNLNHFWQQLLESWNPIQLGVKHFTSISFKLFFKINLCLNICLEFTLLVCWYKSLGLTLFFLSSSSELVLGFANIYNSLCRLNHLLLVQKTIKKT